VFWGVSHYGIEPDPHCLATGVTTAVDAGSAGADTFPGFRKYVIDVSATRLFAYLNISSPGMVCPEVAELQDMRHANVSRAAQMAEAHRGVILGIKVRLTTSSIVSPEAGIRPLHLAREAADAAGLPIMVHPNGAACDSLANILSVMRAGDVLTHCFHGNTCGVLGSDGIVLDAVHEAMEHGVIFDVGHGQGSFKWDVAERACEQGVYPQTISSDLHFYNVNGPVYDLATTASKFLHLGLSLDQVLGKVTATPARAIGISDEIGTLQVAAWGDAVVLELQEGEFELYDAHKQVRIGKRRLVPQVVVKAGKVHRPSQPNG